METSDIKCPCCKAVITVNKETGLILHVEEHKKGPAEFDSFLEKQKSRKQDLSRKFEAAKEKSKTHLQGIEEKIAYAQKKLQDEGRKSEE
jgi:hypothetical protein